MTHTFYLKYKSDKEFKAGVTLGFSLFINIIYAIFKGFVAVNYHSQRFAASAFYYTVLCCEKILLAARLSKKRDVIKDYRCCQFCGLSMIILNTAVSNMTFMIIKNNLSNRYPQYMIYLAALFAFYNFGNAIHNIIIYHKMKVPLYSAIKMISMASAMVSMFFLQVDMLAEFGDGSRWQNDMNILTGSAVYIAIFLMAITIFINSRKQIKLHKSKTAGV